MTGKLNNLPVNLNWNRTEKKFLFRHYYFLFFLLSYEIGGTELFQVSRSWLEISR